MRLSRERIRRPISLRRGATTVIRVVLLAVALAMSAIGIPVPWRVAPPVPRPETETLVDEGEPGDRTRGASRGPLRSSAPLPGRADRS